MKTSALESFRNCIGRFISLLKGRGKAMTEPVPEPPPEWEYIAAGWRVCDSRIKGWNVASVAEAQQQQWSKLIRLVEGSGPLATTLDAHNLIMSFAYVLSLVARQKNRLTILDWGGGLGQYKLFSQALLPDVEIEYHIKEVPVLCQSGRELNPQVIFHESDDSALSRSYDFILASGSFQFSEDWRGLAARLAAATEDYLFITRLPVVQKVEPFVVVQRPYAYGYATEYLCWFLNQPEFLAHLATLNLQLCREFLSHEGPPVRNAPEQCDFRGFLFRNPMGKSD